MLCFHNTLAGIASIESSTITILTGSIDAGSRESYGGTLEFNPLPRCFSPTRLLRARCCEVSSPPGYLTPFAIWDILRSPWQRPVFARSSPEVVHILVVAMVLARHLVVSPLG